MPAALQRQVDRGSNRHAVRNDDVVCLIKKYIGDPELGQKPLLVFTEAQASRIPNIPVDKHPQRVVSDTVKVQWQKLATAVEQYYGDSYKPAAQYLRHLVNGYFHNNSVLEDIPWLQVDGVRFRGEPVFNLHKCVLDALAPSAPLRAIWSRGNA